MENQVEFLPQEAAKSCQCIFFTNFGIHRTFLCEYYKNLKKESFGVDFEVTLAYNKQCTDLCAMLSR